MTSGEGDKTLKETRTIRRMRRKGGAQLSFFPWGLIPTIGLPLIFIFAWGPFAFASIQHDTEEAAKAALVRVGATWAIPHVSGQWVEIDGVAPSKDEADRAVAAVRDEKMKTLFGEWAPATRVTRRVPFVEESKSAAPAAPDPAASPPPVAPEPAQPAAPAPAEPAAPAQPAQPAPVTPTLADPSPPLQTCEQIMADVLGRSHIEFDRSSAAIGSSSKDILDEIAKAAASCPGGMRIEGHTDSRGGATLNNKLSQNRAEAVRKALIARGVAAERLVAEGFGADKPVADNATDDGRARNRRIEIKMIPPT
jgi:outer membrane protein OmpA-like peptidoglycan-associated protein